MVGAVAKRLAFRDYIAGSIPADSCSDLGFARVIMHVCKLQYTEEIYLSNFLHYSIILE